MKELVQIWKRVTGRQYPSSERELRELSNNRLKKGDIDTSAFESNLSECEGLNKFNEDLEFNDGKDAIINRLFERRKKGQATRQPKLAPNVGPLRRRAHAGAPEDQILLARFGVPRRILSDNGVQFVSDVMQQACHAMGVTQSLTPLYHPESNPIERKNRDLKPQLAILVGQDHASWDTHLAAIRFAMNSAVTASTGFSPAYLTFGRELRAPIDATTDVRCVLEEDNFVPSFTPYLKKMANVLAEARDVHERAQAESKKYADEGRRPAPLYKDGDLVLLKTATGANDAAKGQTPKLLPRRDGPYRVRQVCGPTTYLLERISDKEAIGLFMLLMLGFVSIAAGCVIMFLHPYDFIFKIKAQLSDGGEIFEMWRKPQVDLYCRVYLFNITNAEDYMAGKADKLDLKEVGPYVYKEHLEHKVLKFNDNNTMSVIPKHPLTWVPELSEGHSEDDVLFLPHIALLSIAHVVSQKDFFTRMGLNNLISFTKSQPLAKMTAKEFMMGYESQLMTLGNTFLPGWIYFDKLGLIDRMYDFEGDFETIYTGSDELSRSGLIDTYRGSPDLPHWTGKHCSNVRMASDGSRFQSRVPKNESILFYRKSLCRAAPLVVKDEGIKSGLKAFMYSFPDNMMDNGKYIEENKCFCREGKCLPAGLIDVTDCYYGFPIALSYPHYYTGEDVLFSKVNGLNPNKEQHESRIWVQPESGLPIDVSAKFQINMAIGDTSSITNAGKFANLHLPLLWFDIRMYGLPAAMESRFKLYLNILPAVEQGAMYLMFVAGASFIVLSIYRLTFKIMFKSFDAKRGNKPRNFPIGTEIWIDREKNNKDGIYAACEIPLSESDESDPQFDEKPPVYSEDRRPSLLKTHSDKIKELSLRLGDKVYDSVGSLKDKVRDITHAKHIFGERKDSLINKEALESVSNDAYKSDSSDTEKEYDSKYKAVRQSDSDDDCKYLEVLDDGSAFASTINHKSTDRANQLKQLDSNTDDNELIILHVSD